VRAIERLLATLPPGEEAFYEDEVDIHLNPRIGRDWMAPGEQKTVLTPGQNAKHYLAGALHTRTGEVFWVGNGRKNSHLFLQLLRRLVAAFPGARKLHIILDNYGIHSSRLVLYALAEEFHGRVVLNFLPPYSPHRAIPFPQVAPTSCGARCSERPTRTPYGAGSTASACWTRR
jgi:hypothetical protein